MHHGHFLSFLFSLFFVLWLCILPPAVHLASTRVYRLREVCRPAASEATEPRVMFTFASSSSSTPLFCTVMVRVTDDKNNEFAIVFLLPLALLCAGGDEEYGRQ